MFRHFAWVTLAEALLSLSVAAPVPKPTPLTEELLVGTYSYFWGNWPDGIICFEKDGSYTAQHVPGSDTVYAGTWKLDGNTVTITEYSFCFLTGERRSGPAVYAFDFGKSVYPTLAGKSNGTVDVRLTNPKR